MPLLPEKRLPLLTRELCLAPLPQMSQLSFGPSVHSVQPAFFSISPKGKSGTSFVSAYFSVFL